MNYIVLALKIIQLQIGETVLLPKAGTGLLSLDSCSSLSPGPDRGVSGALPLSCSLKLSRFVGSGRESDRNVKNA